MNLDSAPAARSQSARVFGQRVEPPTAA